MVPPVHRLGILGHVAFGEVPPPAGKPLWAVNAVPARKAVPAIVMPSDVCPYIEWSTVHPVDGKPRITVEESVAGTAPVGRPSFRFDGIIAHIGEDVVVDAHIVVHRVATTIVVPTLLAHVHSDAIVRITDNVSFEADLAADIAR